MIDYSLEPGRKVFDRYAVTVGEEPLISIITPYYNAGATIEQTYRCVMEQTFPYFEWIIVNDGSTRSEDVDLLVHLATTDYRIRLFHQENKGIAGARNFAIKQATTEIIAQLDADDLILPSYLECLYWALLKTPEASWAYCGLVGFGGDHHLWSVPFDSGIEKINNIVVGNGMIRKKDLVDVGAYDETHKHCNEDWHLWLKLLAMDKRPAQLPNYYGFWYRIASTGVRSKITEDAQIRKKNRALIQAAVASVPDGISAASGFGLRKQSFPVPQTSNWDKRLSYRSDKPKIMMLVPWLVVGGADKFNLDIVRGLKDKYEISILTTLSYTIDKSWRQRFEEFTPDIFDLAHFLAVDDYAEFIHYFIKSRGINILFLSNSYYGYYLLPWLRMKFPELIIVDFYHSDAMYWRHGGYGRLTVAVNDMVDKTFVGDDSLRKAKIAKGEKREDEIEAVYIGVDETEFDPQNYDGKGLRSRLGLGKRPVVLMLARMEPEKRHLMMVEISAKVRRKMPDIAFLVVGDGPCFKDVKAKVEHMGLQSTVFLTGRIDDVKECYAAADVTLLCSLKEGLALITYESLAMGVPMVSADVGGQSCVIDGKVGRLVPMLQDEKRDLRATTFVEREVEIYAEVICGILQDKPALDSMREECRKRIESGFTTSLMLQKLDREFTALLAGNGSDRRIGKSKALYEIESMAEDYLSLYCEYDFAQHVDGAPADIANSAGTSVAQTPEWQLLKKIRHLIENTWYGRLAYRVYKKWFRK